MVHEKLKARVGVRTKYSLKLGERDELGTYTNTSYTKCFFFVISHILASFYRVCTRIPSEMQFGVSKYLVLFVCMHMLFRNLCLDAKNLVCRAYDSSNRRRY